MSGIHAVAFASTTNPTDENGSGRRLVVAKVGDERLVVLLQVEHRHVRKRVLRRLPSFIRRVRLEELIMIRGVGHPQIVGHLVDGQKACLERRVRHLDRIEHVES